jgi:hypothetical protein
MLLESMSVFKKTKGRFYEISQGKTMLTRLPKFLGTLSSPATYRIIAELKIPKKNNTLSGVFFDMVIRNGTVLGEQITSSGNWQTVIREGAGGSPFQLLRIHFTGFEASKHKRPGATGLF